MTTHRIGTREDWLAARLELLEAEKDLSRRGDAIARQRQALPWVLLDKTYRFDTVDGPATLQDLFRGRSQLLVYHFMYGPTYQAGCPSCSAIADGFNGIAVHLEHHDVAFCAVSSAPLAALLAYEWRMGWSFLWASAEDSDFNFDFQASFTEAQQRDGIEYNYRREPPMSDEAISTMPTRLTPDGPTMGAAMTGTDVATYARERPGVSAFVLQDGAVYHTYSSFGRGVDAIWSVYPWLDRAPFGRNESAGYWIRRHDEYQR